MAVYRVFQVDSFARQIFGGNPAGVVPEAEGLTEEQMRKIARELNNSETAFVLPAEGPDHDLLVRFFTPATEVPLCGHATVAAHYVLASLGLEAPGTVRMKTGAGILPITVEKDGEGFSVIMGQGKPAFSRLGACGAEYPSEPRVETRAAAGEAFKVPKACRAKVSAADMRSGTGCAPASSGCPEDFDVDPVLKAEIAEALGISLSDLRPDCPLCSVSIGNPFVMVGLKDDAVLRGLAPDQAALLRISEKTKTSGFYPFTLHPDEDIRIRSRLFAPSLGIAEDPVTGTAGGPIGAYLIRFGLAEKPENEGLCRFTVCQGEAIGRAGLLDVTVQVKNGVPEDVSISGRAVIAFETQIEL